MSSLHLSSFLPFFFPSLMRLAFCPLKEARYQQRVFVFVFYFPRPFYIHFCCVFSTYFFSRTSASPRLQGLGPASGDQTPPPRRRPRPRGNGSRLPEAGNGRARLKRSRRELRLRAGWALRWRRSLTTWRSTWRSLWRTFGSSASSSATSSPAARRGSARNCEWRSGGSGAWVRSPCPLAWGPH